MAINGGKEATRLALYRQRRGADTSDLRLSLKEQSLAGDAIETFVDVLGGREKLIETLAVATDDAQVNQVMVLLLDPRYDGLDLRRLCAMANLTIADFFGAFRKAMVARAHVQAISIVTDNLLPVVEDVMKRAAPFEVACYTCGGGGQMPDPDAKESGPMVTCPQCRGAGKLLQLPDLDRQKLALELAQLVQQKGGINILQQNMQAPSDAPRPASVAPGGLEALQQVVRDMLARPPVLDAEVVSADAKTDTVTE